MVESSRGEGKSASTAINTFLKILCKSAPFFPQSIHSLALTSQIVSEALLIPESWVYLLIVAEPIDTTKPKSGRRKDLLLPAANKASQVVLVIKNPPASAGDRRDSGLIPGFGRSPGIRNGKLL